jgi:DNA adenine methylase
MLAEKRQTTMSRSAVVHAYNVPLHTAAESPTPPASPFVKWAGGKRQLLPQLKRFVPTVFSAYTEAFLGSGALFFDLAAQGRLEGIPITLIDSNADLIGTYLALAREPSYVIANLRDLARGHARGRDAFYYEVRDRRFNPTRAKQSMPRRVQTYPPELAAQLLYLNRTGFNGLFRLNARGEYNVPVGRYANPRICDERNLTAVSTLLSQPDVSIVHGTFERLHETARPGEFIYFDPPYAPVSATAHFRAYTADGFSPESQERLQKLVITLASRGCAVLVSNSVAPQIEALYDNNQDARRAGLRAYRVPARRAINCDGTSRGSVEEYLITNIDPV